jgi:hypothetical protein
MAGGTQILSTDMVFHPLNQETDRGCMVWRSEGTLLRLSRQEIGDGHHTVRKPNPIDHALRDPDQRGLNPEQGKLEGR